MPEHVALKSRIVSMFGGEDMGRRRGQNKGYVFEKSGSWIGQWREDRIDEEGNAVRPKFAQKLAPSKGKDAISKREAYRLLRETKLLRLDQESLRPSSLMTVQEFIDQKFQTEVVWGMKPSGKKHYAYVLGHVSRAIGKRHLRDVTAVEVQKVIRAKMEAGLSDQTAVHIKNGISAIFRHAKLTGHFVGENPASLFRMKEVRRIRVRSALSFERAAAVISALSPPAREMAFLSIVTSLNVAEMCGLRWKRVNLTADFIATDGEAIRPYALIVRENYYRGTYCDTKTKSRDRALPLDPETVNILRSIRDRARFSGPDDPVFANRVGDPVNELNIARRVLRPLGKAMGIQISWHTFRRTHATLSEQIGMALSDRIAQMGHSGASMTMYYTDSDMDRRRASVGQIASKLLPKPPGAVQ